MINADKLGKRADAEFAAEEARLLDELLAAADLSSFSMTKTRPVDPTNPGSPLEPGAWQVGSPATPEQQGGPWLTGPPAYDLNGSVNLFTDATAGGHEPTDRDEPYETWATGATAPATEIVGPVEEPAASGIGSDSSYEIQSFDVAGEVEGPFELVPRQETRTPVVPQSAALTGIAFTSSNPPQSFPPFAETTLSSDEEPGQGREPQASSSLGGTELAEDETELVEVRPRSVDLSVSVAPEGRSLVSAPGEETPGDLMTSPAKPDLQLSREGPATTPSPSDATASMNRTFAGTSPLDATRPGNLDARYRPWTIRDRGPVAEVTGLSDETPVSGDKSANLDARYRPWILPHVKSVVAEAKRAGQEPPASSPPAPPTSPKFRSRDRRDDTEALTRPTEPASAQAHLVTPSARTAQPSVPMFTENTGKRGERFGEGEPRYRPWIPSSTLVVAQAANSDGEPEVATEAALLPEDVALAAEDAKLADDGADVADLAEPDGEPAAAELGTRRDDRSGVVADETGLDDEPAVFAETTVLADEVASAVADAKAEDKPAEVENLTELSEPPAVVAEPGSTAASVRANDETGNGETLPDPVATPATGGPQAEELLLTVPSAPSRPAESAGPGLSGTTAMSRADRLERIDACFRSLTPRTDAGAQVAESAGEPAAAWGPPAAASRPPAATAFIPRPVPAGRANARPSLAGTSQGGVTAQTATAGMQAHEQEVAVPAPSHSVLMPTAAVLETTTMLGDTKGPRARLKVLVAVLAVVLLVATLGAGFVALKQNRAANQWRQKDQNELALNQAFSARITTLSTELASVDGDASTLHAQTSALNRQIASLPRPTGIDRQRQGQIAPPQRPSDPADKRGGNGLERALDLCRREQLPAN